MIRLRGLVASLLAVVLASATVVASAAAQPAKPPAKGVLTKPPVLVTFVEATFPPEEKAAGKTATVVLRLAIDATGKVTDATVETSGGASFDAAAVAAGRQFLFEPAEIDGRPAPVRILYRYAFTLKPEQPTTSIYSGTVRDRATKAALAGVKLTLDTGVTVTTDAAGRFRLTEVPPGEHAITVEAAGLTPVLTKETFKAGEELSAVYDLDRPAESASEEEADDLEVVVVAPPIVKDVTSVRIDPSQARRVPGTQGDVLKVVQSLPGVGRAAAGSSALVVWGAAPEDTRVYVEGVRIPLLYHYGGVRSVIHGDLVRSVELVPGGYGAANGRGLGGLVNVRLVDLREDGVHGSVQMDPFDVSASLRVPLGEVAGAQAAARYGYLHRLAPIVTDTDLGELFPIPQYFDAQARVAFLPSASSVLEIAGLASMDSVERVVESVDPTSRRSDNRSTKWGRIFARYRQDLDDGAEIVVTPSWGLDDLSSRQRYGDVETFTETQAMQLGVRAHYRGTVFREEGAALSQVTVLVGVDAEMTRAEVRRTGSIASPPREGDRRLFGDAPSDEVANDTWTVWAGSPALFAEADFTFFGGKLHVVPGLRADPYFRSASRVTPLEGKTPSIGLFEQEPFLEPRLSVRVPLHPRFEVHAAYGHYHQPPPPEDLSAVFGTPTLEASSGHHLAAGTSADLGWRIKTQLDCFYTVSSDLVTRSDLESPLLARALTQAGRGRAYGAQLSIRRELADGFFGWISYGLTRSERADADDARFRPFDYDQTHVLTALASYDIYDGLEVGARFRLASGFPRTPVVDTYFDASADVVRPLFGTINSIRLPLFYQLDVRVSKRFRFGGVDLETYLDIQNVTNHENVEEIVYSADFQRKGAIAGIPILPVIGVRTSW